MTERQPASLTGSLLARKGESSPAADSDIPNNPGSLDPSASMQGTPILPDEPDNFLTRGPDMLQGPDDDDEPPPAIGIRDAKPQRSRRAPALVLAVMLVFVLGGAAWLTVKIFSGDGSGTKVAGVEMRSPLEPAAARGADVPAPLGPPPESQGDGSKQAAAAPMPEITPPPPAEPAAAIPQPTQEAASAISEQPAAKPTENAPALQPAPTAPGPVADASPVMAKLTNPPKEAITAPQPIRPKFTAAEPVRKPAATAVMASLAGSGSYRVQLSSTPDSKSAEREKQRLEKRFKDALGGANLEVQMAQLSNQRTVFRVKSNATYSRSAAKQVCKLLVAKKQGCFVTK